VEGRETASDKVRAKGNQDVFRQKALFPMAAETSDDGTDTALINGRSGVHRGREISIRLGMFNNVYLIGQGYL